MSGGPKAYYRRRIVKRLLRSEIWVPLATRQVRLTCGGDPQ